MIAWISFQSGESAINFSSNEPSVCRRLHLWRERTGMGIELGVLTHPVVPTEYGSHANSIQRHNGCDSNIYRWVHPQMKTGKREWIDLTDELNMAVESRIGNEITHDYSWLRLFSKIDHQPGPLLRMDKNDWPHIKGTEWFRACCWGKLSPFH